MAFKVGIGPLQGVTQCFPGSFPCIPEVSLLSIIQVIPSGFYFCYSVSCLSQKPRRVKRQLFFLPYTCMPMKPSRTLWDPSRDKSSLCSRFLFVGNSLCSTSLIFPECQRADSNSCLTGNGRKWR